MGDVNYSKAKGNATYLELKKFTKSAVKHELQPLRKNQANTE